MTPLERLGDCRNAYTVEEIIDVLNDERVFISKWVSNKSKIPIDISAFGEDYWFISEWGIEVDLTVKYTGPSHLTRYGVTPHISNMLRVLLGAVVLFEAHHPHGATFGLRFGGEYQNLLTIGHMANK